MTSTSRQIDLPAQYDASQTEPPLYQQWLDADAFTAHPERSVRAGGDRQPFTIVIPPPNVTSVLHMGHGLNNSVQDVIVRWRRMAGDEALWVPGTDHAGIATQNVVERLVAKEGKSRFDLGRDAFVARTTQFVEETGGTILKQLRAIGSSCDWTRTHYTLSPELSRAVREAFVQLYERGLIYRGHRVIHWCPRCLTSLSDEEAEHAEENGKLYYIRYPISDDASRGITVATTRPETMLGDVAVAVHPNDERYRDLIGKTLRLPVANVDIPIIADEYVEASFGTGAVKITPAHDPNDFEVGKRHGLPMPVIMAPDARMESGTDATGRVPDSVRGRDRFEARATIVEELRAEGKLEKVEPHSHAVRHCYRCDTVVEPRLSDQWFVKMKPLAKPALKAAKDGTVRILPERWQAVYENWLTDIRDWNISRQLWWGHRIPVWYCDRCGAEPIVSRDDVSACPECSGPVWQDNDVLDTWFSSWLWPFSTLGWPNPESRDLKAFYPTDHLITAPEILFFWVARMIMGGYAFMGRTPFHTVLLHGTVRDTKHQKMSKSLGNGIDPLDVVSLYGADALRYTVIAGMGLGADLMLDPGDLEKSFSPGRNFVTKLWNIGRFLLSNIDASSGERVLSIDELDRAKLTNADKWILHRLNVAIEECDRALGPARPKRTRWSTQEARAGLRLNEYAEVARRFVWNEVADWYLESVKGRLARAGDDRDVARAVLVHVFDSALRLLHPVVPFVTEAVWQQLPFPAAERGMLAMSAWPRVDRRWKSNAPFELVRDAVVKLRQLRADYNIPPGKIIEGVIIPAGNRAAFVRETSLIGNLARASLRVARTATQGAAARLILSDGSEVVVALAGIIDTEKEIAKAESELVQLEQQLNALRERLGNERFVARAPAAVVEAEREKEREWTSRRGQLAAKLAALRGA
jgi:valyl-tRNA synthetase